MKPGETAVFRITLRNCSTDDWHTWGRLGGINAIRISYHFFGKDGARVLWDGNRAPLPYSLRPGEPVPVQLQVTAPKTAGSFILAIDLVQEGVSWFSSKGVPAAEHHVEVVNVF